MPELPEVETTKNGLEKILTKKKITKVEILNSNLRWIVDKAIRSMINNQTIRSFSRRGKYILFNLDKGHLMIHLGMSGKINVVDINEPLKKHDHFLLYFNNQVMRFNDPRRFGSIFYLKDLNHKLLNNLGVEPLEDSFHKNYLFENSRNKTQNVKAFIMDSKIVVGVGNIYACESLYNAGINPKTKSNKISKQRYLNLTENIKKVLNKAIKAGGTTLQDFAKVDGKPGYFSQELSVYGRENENCYNCNGKIKRIVQNQRSTFYCPKCQK
jgi:formamidopyrimidine-DNA glycosylase